MPLAFVDSNTFSTPGAPGATDVYTNAGGGDPIAYVALVDLHNIPGGETIQITATTNMGGAQTLFDTSTTAAPTPSVVTVGPFPTAGGQFVLALEQTAGASTFDVPWKVFTV